MDGRLEGVAPQAPVDDAFERSTYWYPFALEGVRSLLEGLAQRHRQVILFGEIYGSGIQSLTYGLANRGIGFRAFDLLADGKYLDWHNFTALCAEHNIEMVPTVATLPFNLGEIKRYSEGDTLLFADEPHMREGVVVKPTRERSDPKVGRVILKYVSDTYLFGDKTDFTDV
ncbi:MAG: hypothetical protein HC828_12860 [Blastochloris sp.]|nr:hypothetical protein [Blastochloris sp.]